MSLNGYKNSKYQALEQQVHYLESLIGGGEGGGGGGGDTRPTVGLLGGEIIDLTLGPQTIDLLTVEHNSDGAIITQVLLVGRTWITGTGKTSTIKIGTTGMSYTELTGAGGHTFNADDSSTLLPTGGVMDFHKIYPYTIPINAPTAMFPPDTVLKADISGDPMDSGVIAAILLGFVLPN